MSVGFELRPLEAGHLDAVAAIEAEVNPSPWSRQLLAGELDLPEDSRHWIVAVDTYPTGADLADAAPTGTGTGTGTGTVIGFGGIMVGAGTAHLLNLGVAPAHQRRGVGRTLCLALITAAAHRQAADLTLEVRASNTAAIALYHRLGLDPTGLRPRYYPDGEDAMIFWLHDLASYRAPDHRALDHRAPDYRALDSPTSCR